MLNSDNHGLPLSTASGAAAAYYRNRVALMRGGEVEKACALLDRRLHRPPSPHDARWLAGLA